MKRIWILPLLAALSCKSTSSKDEVKEGEHVTIAAEDLEPLNNFILETRRLIVADFVAIDCSIQYFEEKMGLTRDFRFVERTRTVAKDGSVVVALKNTSLDQETNIDPALLPRVYFSNGLEVRAYREIRIVFRRKVTRQQPVFISIDARGAGGLAKMWVSGRLEYEQQRIIVNSRLLWDDQFDRYRHHGTVG